jgi:hypothetical protein
MEQWLGCFTLPRLAFVGWESGRFDPRLEGHEVNITDAKLKGAPKYSTGLGQPRPDD